MTDDMRNPQAHFRPSWVEVDYDALAHNVRLVKEQIGYGRTLMAVVKADAYGHGAVAMAKIAIQNGAEYLAVASLAEALELREGGISAPILVLTYVPVDGVQFAIEHDIVVSLYDLELAEAYNAVARNIGKKLSCHIKFDTGMGRLGFFHFDAIDVIDRLSLLDYLNIEGIYTHFSVADEDPIYTAIQVSHFKQIIYDLESRGQHFQWIHAENSAGALTVHDPMFSAVRAGLILYGLNVSESIRIAGAKPALSWKTCIAQVRDFPPDYFIGYGNTYKTTHEERVAILPVGYADGFRRSPQTWREVLINGLRAPLVGRVSMEKIAVKVTHIPDVKIGDEVVLLGKQGNDEITADEVAAWLGTINYEVVCTILPRIPRSD